MMSFNSYCGLGRAKHLLVAILGFSPLFSLSAQAENEFLGTNAGAANTTGDANVIIGDEAGKANLTGHHNVILGNSAASTYVGNGNTDAQNIFIGYQTCNGAPCQADESVFIGHQSGFSMTTGFQNTFVGHGAGYDSTTAQENVFVGSGSGTNVTTGQRNVLIGDEAGKRVTTARGNVGVGRLVMSNLGTGSNTGNFNTAIGNRAGYDMGTSHSGETLQGARNTLVGNAAGYDIGGGMANTMIGDNAGSNTEQADFNTFVGFHAGYDNNRTNIVTNSANRNTGLGAYAGYSSRGGQDNLWLGALADSADWTFDNDGEAGDIASSTIPWAFEFASGLATTTKINTATEVNRATVVGNQSTAIANDTVTLGYKTRVGALGAMAIGTNSNTAHANSVSLGYGAASKAANTVVIGSDAANGNTTSIQPNVDSVTALGTSAYRYSDVQSNKVSVNATTGAAAEIDLFADAGTANNDQWTIAAANAGNFTVSSFSTGSDVALLTIANNGDMTVAGDMALQSDRRLKDHVETIENATEKLSQLEGKRYNWKKELKRDDRKHLGLIAQEVERVFPEVVKADQDGIKSVNYTALIPVLINALNDQQQQIKKQQAQIDTLQKQIKH